MYLNMQRPSADLGKVHVGVSVFLYESQKVRIEGGRWREEGKADRCK